MSNDSHFCSYGMILLGFMTIILALILSVFTLVLTNDNHHMLSDATIASGYKDTTFKVAFCEIGTCKEEKTFWKTVLMPASTMTETATVYVPDYDGPTQAATIDMDVQPTTLAPRVLPTSNVEEAEKKKFSIRGMKHGDIVDVNKPEMQM
ncbi:unnamed protein product [Aureobasidium mustum]|uniref:Uncharacterized protein n=1 Tax=Aureobasidium mustum TaxID=2773714 RepID=A0A9N8K3A7_9PEZI|nr:unnamed protein product [Aureobasidium mustum]